MYTNFEDYERRINELNNQISELQNQVRQYQALISEKDELISKLYQENQQLKGQSENIEEYASPSANYQQQSSQVPNYEQKRVQSPVYSSQPSQSPQYTQPATQAPATTPQENTNIINKRECPKCGASGFAIKEVEDKSRLLSYVPRRIYAKKRVCTKCFYEW